MARRQRTEFHCARNHDVDNKVMIDQLNLERVQEMVTKLARVREELSEVKTEVWTSRERSTASEGHELFETLSS